jgi:hypothetical protein
MNLRLPSKLFDHPPHSMLNGLSRVPLLWGCLTARLANVRSSFSGELRLYRFDRARSDIALEMVLRHLA